MYLNTRPVCHLGRAPSTDRARRPFPTESLRVHLLVTPGDAGGASRLIEATADAYARYLAEAHGHEDAVWDERYDGTPVRPRRYLLACMRYIEMNPLRAGLVRAPGAWRWSSYRANADGAPDALVTPHASYAALGRSPEARRAAYRALFARALP